MTTRYVSLPRHALRSVTIALVVLAWLASPASPDPITHTAWEIHRAGLVSLPSKPGGHGEPGSYRYAPPVPAPGSPWQELTGSHPGALNPMDVHYLGPNGDYSSALRTCLTEADFTYFQTFVALPGNVRLDEVVLTMGPVDDGARVMIFNSRYPAGHAPAEGYVLIGQTETCDLRDHFQPGEVNRIVVQHIDDCAAQAWIHTVELSINGTAVQQQGKSWGGIKTLYR